MTRPDYLANRAGKKMRGHSDENRERCRARGGEVGAEGMVKKSEMLRSPETKYKRSKITFSVTSIVLTCAPFCTKLLEILFPSQICHLSRKREAGRLEGHLG